MNDVTIICPKCKQSVTWNPVKFDTDEMIWCLNWTCENCGHDVVWFEDVKKDANGR